MIYYALTQKGFEFEIRSGRALGPLDASGREQSARVCREGAAGAFRVWVSGLWRVD